ASANSNHGVPTPKTASKAESQVGSLFVDVGGDIALWCADQTSQCASKPQLKAEDANDSGAWLGILISALLPVLLIGAFLYFMFRQAQGTNNQAMSFGKSRA